MSKCTLKWIAMIKKKMTKLWVRDYLSLHIEELVWNLRLHYIQFVIERNIPDVEPLECFLPVHDRRFLYSLIISSLPYFLSQFCIDTQFIVLGICDTLGFIIWGFQLDTPCSLWANSHVICKMTVSLKDLV